MDAMVLKVCHNCRIHQHHGFDKLAARGKTSGDWFYGFKVHLVVNESGVRLNMTVTPGNLDDRKPAPDLLRGLFGQVIADRGYVGSKPASGLRH